MTSLLALSRHRECYLACFMKQVMTSLAYSLPISIVRYIFIHCIKQDFMLPLLDRGLKEHCTGYCAILGGTLI